MVLLGHLRLARGGPRTAGTRIQRKNAPEASSYESGVVIGEPNLITLPSGSTTAPSRCPHSVSWGG